MTNNLSPNHASLLMRVTTVSLLLCAVLLVIFPFFDFDIFWHLANGREMLAQGRIINEEVFSYTKAGTPFSNHEWLAQILLYAVYVLAGDIGLNLFKITIATTVIVLLFRTCRMLGANALLAALLSTAAILISAERYLVRPELFSLLGVALLGYILHGYRTERLSAVALRWIPLIMLLWDWLHGAVFGVVLLGIWALSENLKFLLRHTLSLPGCAALSGQRLKDLNFWLAISLAVMISNPWGLLSYDIFVQLINGNTLVQSVEEFRAATWAAHYPFWMLLGITLATVLCSWRRVDLTTLVVVIAFAVAAIRYRRAISEFGIVVVPLLAMLLPALTQRWTAQTARRITQAGVVSSVIAVIAYTGYAKFVETNGLIRFGFGTKALEYPEGAVHFIQTVNLRGNLYNSGSLGGYLAFFITPARKIFQYNHHTVFGDTAYYVKNPRELQRWNINYALADTKDELDSLFPSTRWAQVYRDSSAVLLLRRAPENQAVIDHYEVLHFDPHKDAWPQMRELALNPAAYPRLMMEMSNYLTYRAHPDAAKLFCELMYSANSTSLSNERRTGLLVTAGVYNPELATCSNGISSVPWHMLDIYRAPLTTKAHA